MWGKGMYHVGFLILMFSFISRSVDTTPENPIITYDFLYREGVESYLEEDWEKCKKHFEGALEDWHWWKDNVAKCRRECSEETAEAAVLASKLSEDDRFFERAVRNTLCVVKCKKNVFGSRMDRIVEGVVNEDFEMRKPYDYLQLCYYKMGMLKEAADAAATVLSVQPEHEVMMDNLKYYLREGVIGAEDVLNLELKEYGKEYILGNSAYNKADYEETITHMEKSLSLFYKAYEECRYLCEKPFDQGWYPDFISSVANHYTFTLRCKRRCIWQLSNLYGEIDDDFYASYFNYLQYSYYQEGDTKKACEAVASALHVNPDDAVQIRNKQFYLAEEISEDFFVPRKDVVAFMERESFEEKLLEFIETNFIFLTDEFLDEDDEDMELSPDTPKNKKPQSLMQQISEKARAIRKRAVDQYKNISQMGIRLLQTERELGGQERMVADGFASPLECLVLSELTKVAAVEGDGYKHRVSPHTQSENFHGVTLGRAGLMVHAKIFADEVLDLILGVTDHCQDYLERYFNLKKPLYFTFTHLVCRTAKPEMATNRSLSDLSHEVHVDNCILQDSGQCLRIPPAYTHRDYSAVLYLNDDFEGGEFIFTHDRSGLSHESIVQPKCGRMVAFSAGPENPHGVLPVLDGSRCAIGMWFTHDERYKELERTLAEKLLERIRDGDI
ncbi:prolyl 3-hydroxylase 1-like isoform X2 [Panulirus ornatus]|uniref:prolyl 3-hydroxylase 1-like isoform X2 n=1 Tax=Panulirus ornatus TaxID=150431 RepID=UPI003A8C3FE2